MRIRICIFCIFEKSKFEFTFYLQLFYIYFTCFLHFAFLHLFYIFLTFFPRYIFYFFLKKQIVSRIFLYF